MWRLLLVKQANCCRSSDLERLLAPPSVCNKSTNSQWSIVNFINSYQEIWDDPTLYKLINLIWPIESIQYLAAFSCIFYVFFWKVQSLESQEQNLLNKIKIFAIVIEKKKTTGLCFYNDCNSGIWSKILILNRIELHIFKEWLHSKF